MISIKLGDIAILNIKGAGYELVITALMAELVNVKP